MRFPRKRNRGGCPRPLPQGNAGGAGFHGRPIQPVKARRPGTVEFVDDIATVHVKWDCGSGLGVAYGVDKIRILEGGDFE